MNDQVKNALILGGSIIIAGVFVGGGLLISKRNVKPIDTSPKQIAEAQLFEREINVKSVEKDDFIRGAENPRVYVIEYSDTECPFCKTFHMTMKSVIANKELAQSVAWVYRHFPLDSLHKKARYEALALECAGELGGQNGFWNLLDKIFIATPSNDGLDTSILPDLAASVNLPISEFSKCLSKNSYASKIETRYQEAISAGGTGTPFSIIVAPEPITEMQKLYIKDVFAKIQGGLQTISFSKNDPKVMTMSGAIPENTVTALLKILVK